MLQTYCRCVLRTYLQKKNIFYKFTEFLTLPIFNHCTYWLMGNSAYFVKSTLPRAFSILIWYLAGMLQTYCICAWRSLMQKKYFWQICSILKFANFCPIFYHCTYWLRGISAYFVMSPPEGLGDILFFPGRLDVRMSGCPSVCPSVCHESCPLCNLKPPEAIFTKLHTNINQH